MSFDVDVDLEEVERLTYEGEQTLHASAQTMWALCDDAAKEEQSEHKYQNRTGNTEAGTFALLPLVAGDDVVEVELAVRTEYASFLEARRFTDFPDIVKRCEANVEGAFNDDAEKLSRL